MTAAVAFEGVTRHFGDVRAVDGVDLEIAEGAFFAMLGPSGSGKTTCLRLIAGFEQPTSGSIQLHGAEAAGLPPYERDVNTVFQDYALFPHMTVGENVAYGLMIKKVPKPERDAAGLEVLRLDHLYLRTAHQGQGVGAWVMAWVKAQGKGKGAVGIPAPASTPEFLVKLVGEKYQIDLVSAPYRGSACSRSAAIYAITAMTATQRCTSAGSSLSGVSASV